MVTISSLWLPILLSAVFVFVVSSIIHMMLGYHRADYKTLPAEDQVMEALRKFNIPPGDYMMPCAGSSKAMKDPVSRRVPCRRHHGIRLLRTGVAPALRLAVAAVAGVGR